MANHFTFNDQVINVGDTVRLHQQIKEGEKSRIQIFEGIIIAVQNELASRTFTIRRMGTNGVGVEKIVPVNVPGLMKIEVKSRGDVRRAKLFYLRQRVGKAASRVKEKAVVRTAVPTA